MRTGDAVTSGFKNTSRRWQQEVACLVFWQASVAATLIQTATRGQLLVDSEGLVVPIDDRKCSPDTDEEAEAVVEARVGSHNRQHHLSRRVTSVVLVSR